MHPGGPAVRRHAAALLTGVLGVTLPVLAASTPASAVPVAAKIAEPVERTVRLVVVQRSRVRIELRDAASIRKVRVVGALPRRMTLRKGVLRGWARKGRTVIRVQGISTLQGERNRRLRLKVVVVGRPQVAVPGTSLLTRGPGGRPGNAPSYAPTLSADGSTVAFLSRATNLLASPLPPTAGYDARVFVWDRTTARTELVSVAADGTPLTGSVMDISDDGSRVLIRSGSSLLLRDRSNATTREVATDAQAVDLSGDGNLVTYSKDGHTTRVDLVSGTSEDLGVPSFTAVSPNGRHLVARDGDTSYLWDTTTRTTLRVLRTEPVEPHCYWMVRALADDASRGVVSGGCDRATGSSVVDVATLTPLVGASILDANGSATWVAMANHRGRVVLAPVGGDTRVLSEQPAGRGGSPSVAVAGDGEVVAWGVTGTNVVRDAYTPHSQVYFWTSGR